MATFFNQNVSLQEKKNQNDRNDELNCFQEAIVHDDGDKRHKITESAQNDEYIIRCIGQLQADYKCIQHKYEQIGSSYGTGTVFQTKNAKCFVITAAHNIRKQIKECQNCTNYMENKQEIIKCIHCGHHALVSKMISATSIQFKRREIKKHVSVYDEEEKETIHYEFGDNRKCYMCKCEYIDENNYSTYPITTSGYDFCLLSFINVDNYNYSKYCKNIKIQNDISAIKKKSIPQFSIYGYPMAEKSKSNKMYGMQSIFNNYLLKRSMYSNEYYLIQKEIDTSGGQSGAVIWYKQNDMTIIFAVHSGGNSKKMYNVATIMNENILNEIQQIGSGKVNLYSIGSNKNGQQGIGTIYDITEITKIKMFKKKIKNIVSGFCLGYIIFDNGTYECCGYNQKGVLGIGHFNDISKWHEIKEMKIKNIFSAPNGSYHSFCISTTGKLYAVGWNAKNRFGIKTNEVYNDNWTEIPTSLCVQKVSTAYWYTTFLSKTGEISAVGYSAVGGLGLGEQVPESPNITIIKVKAKFIDIYCGSGHTLGIDDNKYVWSWGWNENGQLGHGDNDNRFEPTIIKYFVDNNIKINAICCGAAHDVILSSDNKVYCLGGNEEYQCGNGKNEKDVLEPQLNKKLLQEIVVKIRCGAYHSVVKTKENCFYLWGHNGYNQCVYSGSKKNPPEYIKKPRLFNSNCFDQDEQIIDIYPGYYETRIVTRNQNIDEDQKESGFT